MPFTFTIHDHFLGEFSSPSDAFDSFHHLYYCQHCGETYARRISSLGRIFWSHPGTCLYCAQKHPPSTFPLLRLPYETREGFAPAQLLTWEFKIALAAYAEELGLSSLLESLDVNTP